MGAEHDDLVQAMLRRLDLLAQVDPAEQLPSLPPGPKGRALVDALVSHAVAHHGGSARALSALQATQVEPASAPVAGSEPPQLPVAFRELTPEAPRRYSIGETHAMRVTEHVDAEATASTELGRGGMGRVLLAFDRHIGRQVAVKELLPSEADESETEREVRFIREARICAQLEHPNVVPVHELGRRDDGRLYYTMKVIRGRTLADAMADAPTLSQRSTLLGHYLGLCQAIAYAHSQGVVHGDIKPQNVMIGEFGETIVLDWGGARVLPKLHNRIDPALAEIGTKRTRGSGQYGTPLYLSPEQALGGLGEASSDVWALGVVLYQLLTGDYPFVAPSLAELLPKIIEGRYVSALARTPGVDPVLSAIVDKALCKAAAARYPTAWELMKELEAYLNGDRVRSYAYSSLELVRRFVARNRAAVAVAGASLTLLLALSVLSYRRLTHSRDLALAAEQRAVLNERTARHNLAEVFSTQASVTRAGGDVASASLFAAKALTLEERPDARGQLVALLDSIRWQPSARQAGAVGLGVDGSSVHATSRGFEAVSEAGTMELRQAPQDAMQWAISERGSTVLALAPKALFVWQRGAAVGREYTLTELPHTAGTGSQLAISANGASWALGDANGNVRVWLNGRAESLQGFGEAVSALAVSNAAQVFVGGRRGRLTRFSSSSAATEPTRELIAHTGTITALQLGRGDNLLLSASLDRTVRLWNTSENATVSQSPIANEAAVSVSLSADGAFGAWALTDASIRVFDLTRNRSVMLLHAGSKPLERLAFSAGLDISSVNRDHALQRWVYQPESEVGELSGRSNVLAVASYDAGRGLVSAGVGSAGICIWDRPNRRCKTRLPTSADSVRALSVSPNSSLLAVGGSQGFALLWSLSQHLPLKVLVGHTADVRSLAFSPSGQRVLTASLDGSVREWDLDGHTTHRFDPGTPVSAARYARNGQSLAVASRDGSVTVLDLAFNAKTRFAPTTEWATDVQFANFDSELIVSYADHSVRVFDLASAKLTHTLEGFSGRVLCVAVSPDQRWFAAAGEDAVVRVYDAKTKRLTARLEHHSAEIRALTFSPSELISASDDHSIRLWSLPALTADATKALKQLQQEQRLTLQGTLVVSASD